MPRPCPLAPPPLLPHRHPAPPAPPRPRPPRLGLPPASRGSTYRAAHTSIGRSSGCWLSWLRLFVLPRHRRRHARRSPPRGRGSQLRGQHYHRPHPFPRLSGRLVSGPPRSPALASDHGRTRAAFHISSAFRPPPPRPPVPPAPPAPVPSRACSLGPESRAGPVPLPQPRPYPAPGPGSPRCPRPLMHLCSGPGSPEFPRVPPSPGMAGLSPGRETGRVRLPQVR